MAYGIAHLRRSTNSTLKTLCRHLRSWIFGILALFWISTNFVSLGPGWQGGIGLMNEGGVFGWKAAAVVAAGPWPILPSASPSPGGAQTTGPWRSADR